MPPRAHVSFLGCGQGGTIVNHDHMYAGDVLIEDGTVKAVGKVQVGGAALPCWGSGALGPCTGGSNKQ